MYLLFLRYFYQIILCVSQLRTAICFPLFQGDPKTLYGNGFGYSMMLPSPSTAGGLMMNILTSLLRSPSSHSPPHTSWWKSAFHGGNIPSWPGQFVFDRVKLLRVDLFHCQNHPPPPKLDPGPERSFWQPSTICFAFRVFFSFACDVSNCWVVGKKLSPTTNPHGAAIGIPLPRAGRCSCATSSPERLLPRRHLRCDVRNEQRSGMQASCRSFRFFVFQRGGGGLIKCDLSVFEEGFHKTLPVFFEYIFSIYLSSNNSPPVCPPRGHIFIDLFIHSQPV